MTDANAILRWEEPPASAGHRGKFDPEAVYADLQESPGEWAVIAENVSQSFRHSSPLLKRLEDRHCDVAAAKDGDGYIIYARYQPQARAGRGRQAA